MSEETATAEAIEAIVEDTEATEAIVEATEAVFETPEASAETTETVVEEVIEEVIEDISYHAVEKEGNITAIWEMQGRKHHRTIDPRSGEGKQILALFETAG